MKFSLRGSVLPLLALSLGLLGAAHSTMAHVLVFKNGKTLEVQSPPKWAFGQASVIIGDGRRRTIKHSAVDHAATATRNPDKAKPKPASRVLTKADLQNSTSTINVSGTGRSTAAPRKRGSAPQAGDANWAKQMNSKTAAADRRKQARQSKIDKAKEALTRVEASFAATPATTDSMRKFRAGVLLGMRSKIASLEAEASRPR